MLDDVSVKMMDYSLPSSRDEGYRRQFADRLGDCDYIFAQTALMSHTGEHELRERYGQRVVTIANFYFRGLFPDSCYVGDFDNRLDVPSSVNSLIVLDAFRRGLSEAQAVREFDIASFDRLGLLDAWSSSMAEMHRREANGTVDVPGAALMESACRRYPAFLTMNHPSAPMLTEYLGSALRTVGIRFNHVNVIGLPDPLAVHDTTPIHDAVAAYFDLPYRTSQSWKINSLSGRFVALDEYVAHCYAAYRAAPPGTLLCHSPSDLVPALRADAALAYLVDPAIEAPRADHAGQSTPPPPSLPSAELMAHAMAPLLTKHTRPLMDSLDELKLFTHHIHSFLEVADPKIERILQTATKPHPAAEPAPAPIVTAVTAAPAPVVAPPAVRHGPERNSGLLAACAASALAGALVGSLIAAIL